MNVLAYHIMLYHGRFPLTPIQYWMLPKQYLFIIFIIKYLDVVFDMDGQDFPGDLKWYKHMYAILKRVQQSPMVGIVLYRQEVEIY